MSKKLSKDKLNIIIGEEIFDIFNIRDKIPLNHLVGSDPYTK